VFEKIPVLGHKCMDIPILGYHKKITRFFKKYKISIFEVSKKQVR
jgi:hypothetical protein